MARKNVYIFTTSIQEFRNIAATIKDKTEIGLYLKVIHRLFLFNFLDKTCIV